MDSKLHSVINLNSYFCPNCHHSQFFAHPMTEYSREWNKCSSCGYMERKAITKARILNVLVPEQLTETFIDPIFKIRNDSCRMCQKCKKIKNHNNCDNCCNGTCCN